MTAFLLISTGILLLIAVPIGMAMGTASLLTILQGGTQCAYHHPEASQRRQQVLSASYSHVHPGR